MVVLGMMFATPNGSLAQRLFQRRIFRGAFSVAHSDCTNTSIASARPANTGETVAAGEHCSSAKSLPLEGQVGRAASRMRCDQIRRKPHSFLGIVAFGTILFHLISRLTPTASPQGEAKGKSFSVVRYRDNAVKLTAVVRGALPLAASCLPLHKGGKGAVKSYVD